jgi:hypothetical protein
MAADKILVCYRRDDSAGHVGRLHNRLNQRFSGRVFMDAASINIGQSRSVPGGRDRQQSRARVDISVSGSPAGQQQCLDHDDYVDELA